MLLVTFDNGELRRFDVKPYLDDSFFAPLRNEQYFRLARVNPLTVEWPGDVDTAPEEIYFESTPVT
jgi:hypothetical protein